MDLDHANDGAPGRPENAFPPPRVPWSAGEGLLLLVAFILIHQAFNAMGSALVPAEGRQIFSLGVGSGAVLLVFYAFLRARSQGVANAARVIGLHVPDPGRAIRRSILPLALGVIALPAYMIARASMLEYLDIPPSQQPIVTRLEVLLGRDDFIQLGVLVFLVVIVVPVTEELAFRGMLYLPLRARLGSVRAAVAVSAMFAALHWTRAPLIENLSVMGYLIILALVFTQLMEATRNLVAPMLAHAAHNAFMIALIILAGGGAERV